MLRSEAWSGALGIVHAKDGQESTNPDNHDTGSKVFSMYYYRLT